MQKGQLGTEGERRVIFIWEGAVARLPDHQMVRTWERVKCNLGLYGQALGYWEVSERGLNMMWTLLARTQYRIDLCVTTRPEGFAQAVAKRVENENWPVRYVFQSAPQDLGRRLPSMPDVDRIYFGLDEQRWAYGPHGTCIQPDQPVPWSA